MAGRPPLEVADVFRHPEVEALVGRYPAAHRRVVRAITACRTAALGGHVDVCDECGHQEISYNSCRDRHCPKCQESAAAEWVDAQQKHLRTLEDASVSFDWKDYAHGHRQRTFTLDVTEFARRFLLHVLPKRFVRIRYYGFLANACRENDVALCRQLLDLAAPAPETDQPDSTSDAVSPDDHRCPSCRRGRVSTVAVLAPDTS